MHPKIHDTADVITVIAVHVSAIGITLLNVEMGLKIISLLVAIGYTAWRWFSEYKKRNKK